MLTVLLVAAAGFGVYGTLVDSRFTWFYVPLTVAYAGIVGWLHRRFRFNRLLLWALTVAALGNLAGGILILGGEQLYVMPLVGPVAYDDVQHGASTGMVAIACWWIIGEWFAGSRGPRIVTAVLMAAGLGTVIEMAEFVGASLWDTNVGGYADSMVDLISNLGGAIVAGLLLAWRAGPNPDD